MKEPMLDVPSVTIGRGTKVNCKHSLNQLQPCMSLTLLVENSVSLHKKENAVAYHHLGVNFLYHDDSKPGEEVGI